MNVAEMLGHDVFKADSKPHIEIDAAKCGQDCHERLCVRICPAERYSLGPDGYVSVDSEGCLECGTCMIVCPREAIRWHYPGGGFGVQFRFG